MICSSPRGLGVQYTNVIHMNLTSRVVSFLSGADMIRNTICNEISHKMPRFTGNIDLGREMKINTLFSSSLGVSAPVLKRTPGFTVIFKIPAANR